MSDFTVEHAVAFDREDCNVVKICRSFSLALPWTSGLYFVACLYILQISALKCGLLPLCAETMAVDDVSYYEYVGAIMDAERRDKLRRALGPANKASSESLLTIVVTLCYSGHLICFVIESLQWTVHRTCGCNV